MRSPIVAMLWENWRLTRIEVAQRAALTIAALFATIVLFESRVQPAFWMLIVVYACFWFSIAKLNGGRFMDGYKPGFPLHLLYTRPVRTSSFVAVAMAYDALSCATMYLASAAVVGIALGQSLPLLSAAAWLVTFHVACTCLQWSTRNRVFQWVGSIVVGWPLFFLLFRRAGSPPRLEFSHTEYAVMALICVASLVIAIAGVARQRRGDNFAADPRKAGAGGFPAWLINVFRFPCPVSSATKAQLWFELRSSGLPVLVIGLGVALSIFVLFAIGVVFEIVRTFAVGVAFFAAPITLFLLGSNAFGIRRKQGRTYAGAFELTLPHGTASLAGLKVLVRTACVSAGLMAIVFSVWAASSLLDEWSTWIVNDNNAVPGLLLMRDGLAKALEGQGGYAHVALAVVAPLFVAGVIVWSAAREALRARYGRKALAADWLPALWCLALVAVALAGRHGIASPSEVRAVIGALGWIAMAGVVIATAYLLGSTLAERVLSIRYVCAALAMSAVLAVAWLSILHATGVSLPQMTATSAVWLLWPIPLLLMQCFLAPWSLNRVRQS